MNQNQRRAIEAANRVANGAAFLDRVRPGWATLIDLNVLDLSHECNCILGQLHPDGQEIDGIMRDGYYLGCILLDLRCNDPERLGFEADGGELDPTHEELERAWVKLIKTRHNVGVL